MGISAIYGPTLDPIMNEAIYSGDPFKIAAWRSVKTKTQQDILKAWTIGMQVPEGIVKRAFAGEENLLQEYRSYIPQQEQQISSQQQNIIPQLINCISQIQLLVLLLAQQMMGQQKTTQKQQDQINPEDLIKEVLNGKKTSVTDSNEKRVSSDSKEIKELKKEIEKIKQESINSKVDAIFSKITNHPLMRSDWGSNSEESQVKEELEALSDEDFTAMFKNENNRKKIQDALYSRGRNAYGVINYILERLSNIGIKGHKLYYNRHLFSSNEFFVTKEDNVPEGYSVIDKNNSIGDTMFNMAITEGDFEKITKKFQQLLNQ